MNSSSMSGKALAVIVIILIIFLITSCSSNPNSAIYDAAIREGQTAAQDVIDQGNASALTIALVDRDQIIWSQSFGFADREARRVPTETTMFGIGSVSKMFAAIAVMKLVDKGLINLDTPLVHYLPSFRMASSGYEKITVRMLLNHSSGFPGTDYRNAETTSPVPGYLDQVLQSLSVERLKAPPGYMNVYCNDGFTLTEALIQAVTGKSYVKFVQDEILTPLDMSNSRYTTTALPDGSYAKGYIKGAVQPLEFINVFASGGLYTTARDMGRVAMMFLGDGAVGNTRILSKAAVTQMATDQTVGTFNPVQSNSFKYGLGWDSVSQPGLGAVGLNGWIKGGDVTEYHAAMIVSPQAQLGVVVIGASNFGSEQATAIAERIMLRALAENRKIATFPSPLPPVVPPVMPVPDGLLAVIAGEYAEGAFIYQLQPQSDNSLLFSYRSNNGWTQLPVLKYRGDGWFSSDQNPLTSIKAVEAGGTQYIIKQSPKGFGHYLDNTIMAQRVRAGNNLSTAWSVRLSSTWLVVNENPDSLTWLTMDPRLRLSAIPELNGLIAVRPPADQGFHIVDPSKSDIVAEMMLIIPQINGRDLDDLNIVMRDSEEWASFGSYMHCPLASVGALPHDNVTHTITIGADGYAEWRSIATDVISFIKISTTGAWRLYDPSFACIANGKGNVETSLPAGSGLAYLVVFGDPGEIIAVTVQ